VIVEDGGHLVILEHPEVVNGHLAELLTQVVGNAGDAAGRRSARG